MANLRRDGPEPLLALPDPAVTAIQQVVAKQPQRQVVAPDRRRRQPVITRHQTAREILHVTSRPVPRKRHGKLAESSYQQQSRLDRGVGQQPRLLLSSPPRQHRRKHRRRLIKMHHTGRQNQMGRARNTHADPSNAVNLDATMTTGSYQLPTSIHATRTPAARHETRRKHSPRAPPAPVNSELIRGLHALSARSVTVVVPSVSPNLRAHLR
jgi:hypothetical protein